MADPKPLVDLELELARLERIIGSLENDPDVAVRERTAELVESVDVVHRELVWKVGQRIHEADPALFERLLADPLTSLLFEMYGLVAPAAKDVDTENEPTMLIGLDALAATIPAPYSWYRAAAPDELPDGAFIARDVEGERVLLARLDGVVHAYVDQCPGSPLTLNAGVIRDGILLCPWHDCRFDLRTGLRVDANAPGLTVLQSAVTPDEIRIGLRSRRAVA
ncbi:MAG TPA: Rieske (2Fe-2S) protein [Candidatus Limnocylindria bacterium]